jgi:transcription elongation GreA/GreB family factor
LRILVATYFLVLVLLLMDKHHLHRLISTALNARYEAACQAAQQAYETATHEENVAENKYDTLGLEASYLAEGQARRVAQAEDEQQRFQHLKAKMFPEDEKISLGAVVDLSDQHGQIIRVFISPVAGGLSLTYDEAPILLVTCEAPLGKVLSGAYLGDEVSVGDKCYEIVALH